jgi:hypothetical protein
MRMRRPTTIVPIIAVLPLAGRGHRDPLVLVDLPVDVVIVLEQQKGADQSQRPEEAQRRFGFA